MSDYFFQSMHASPEADIAGGSFTYGLYAGVDDAPALTLDFDPDALRFPMRGAVQAYADPTEPVGEDDWEVLNDPT